MLILWVFGVAVAAFILGAWARSSLDRTPTKASVKVRMDALQVSNDRMRERLASLYNCPFSVN